jgi:hypothetical protein
MLNQINFILSNKIIREFLENDAREQVAKDIRAKTGSGTTAKAVEVLLMNGNDKTIADRYLKYFAAGVTAAAKLRAETITA